MARISRDEPSQNNCPDFFSCHRILCCSTNCRNASGLYRLSADLANDGFSEMKFSGCVCMLVKLHRPPPEIRIFSPMLALCSRTRTDRPRLPASIAHIRPAAPAPTMITSAFMNKGDGTPRAESRIYERELTAHYTDDADSDQGHPRNPWLILHVFEFLASYTDQKTEGDTQCLQCTRSTITFLATICSSSRSNWIPEKLRWRRPEG